MAMDFRNGSDSFLYTVKRIEEEFGVFSVIFWLVRHWTAASSVEQPEMEQHLYCNTWIENQKAFYYNQMVNCMPSQGQSELWTGGLYF